MVDDGAQGRRRPGRRRGLAARPGRRTSTPRRTSSTRRTSAPGRGPSATRSPAYDVFYAGKAFLCTTVARWVAEEGLCLDVCSDGELTVALRAGFDPARIGYHGNTKTEPELRRAVAEGVGRIIVDSFDEIDAAGAGDAPSLGRTQPVMVRVTAGVEAHTHEYIATAHEDQKFGFSITSGDALEAVRRVVAAPGLELLGLHSHIGSQIFDTSGFEVAARRVLALHAQVGDELGVTMPELDLGGGFGIAYTTQDDPSDPAQLAIEMTKIVEHECRALGIARAAAVDRARPRDRRARRCAPSTPSARSSGSSSTGERCAPTSASTAA